MYSDLVISHFPNAQFLLDTLRHGQFPLWSPMILSGYPFAADPLSGIWYPLGWLAYLLPLPLGFNVIVLCHLWWSGVGMLLFLRGLGLEDLPALAGALVWELLPKTFAHFGAGHLSLVYAIAWTPWLLWAEQRRDRTGYRLGPGLIIGLLTLADVRWAAYAVGLWLAYSFHRVWGNSVGAGSEPAPTHFVLFSGWVRDRFENVVLAGLIAAPQLIPLAEYTRLSSRVTLTAADNLTLSLEPLQFFGLIAPNFQSYAEWTVYLGALPLLALVWALAYRNLRNQVRFWLGVAVVTVLLALGSNFPPNLWLFQLPGVDLLRVPARFMLIFGFAMAVVLARFLQIDLRGRRDNEPFFDQTTEASPKGHGPDGGTQEARRGEGIHHRPKNGTSFWANLASFGLVAFPWIIVVGIWVVTGSPSLPYLWGAAGMTIGGVGIFLKKSEWVNPSLLLVAAIGFLVLDLGSVAQSNFIYRGPAAVLAERASTLKTVQDQPGIFRIYSPSYSIPQQTAARLGQETVQGIDPLQLQTYLAFLQEATGIPMQHYSVTVPPFELPDLGASNRDFLPDAGLLGLLNVRFVIADYPLQVSGLENWNVDGAVYIYQNMAWRPRAWVQDAEGIDQSWRAGDIRERTPNRMLIQADGPGELVLSELEYPGWQVKIDGIPSQIHSAYGILRAVRLDPGRHQVEFSFQPVSVWLGLLLGVIGWAWVGWSILRRKERHPE